MSFGGYSDVKTRKYDAKSADYVSTSKVELDTFSIHWSIQNSRELTNDVAFYSPVYRGGPKTNHSWILSVTPSILGAEDAYHIEKSLSVFLILTKPSDPQSGESVKGVKATFEVSLLNEEGEPEVTEGSKTDTPVVFTPGKGWGVAEFICGSFLDPSEIIFEDSLTIHCRVWIQLEFEHSTVPGMQAPAVTKKALEDRVTKQLRLDFKDGFETGAFTDMTLVTKTKTFKTHKFVLAARSPVFKAMLSSEMQEATQNLVEIQDFDEETAKNMLQFLYSGEVTALSTDRAWDLLRMADKYEIRSLKEHLEDVLGNYLDFGNVLKVLANAEMYSASKLKKSALNFATKCKGALEKTEAFKELMQANPNILIELYKLL